jgi:TetR/AcrR family transcriptional regulator
MRLTSMQTRLSTEERQAEIVAAALRLARDIQPGADHHQRHRRGHRRHPGCGVQALPHQGRHLAGRDALGARNPAAEAQAAADESATPLDALAAMFRAHVEFVIAHPGVPRFIFHELQQPADSAAKQEVRAVLQGYRKLLLGRSGRIDRTAQVARTWTPKPPPRSFVGLSRVSSCSRC